MSNLADEPDDIDADIRAAFEQDAGTVQTPEPLDDRPRDEHGRFAPKEAQEETVDKPPEVAQSATVVAPVAEPEKAIQPPHSLKATAKAIWNTLPPDIQQEFLRVEGEVQNAKAEWAPKGELYNKFEAILAPVADRLAVSGIDRAAYVQALVAADNLLRTDPQRGFQLLAHQYGYQLPNGQQPQFQQQPTQFVDPTVAALQAQVQQLVESQQSQQTAQEQAQQAAYVSEIEAFRADPAHLYFDNVSDTMSALLRSGKAADLPTAYDMAVHADPTIRGLLQTAVKAPAPGKPNGKNVTGSPGLAKPNGKAADPNSSIDDDIRAAMQELSGRV